MSPKSDEPAAKEKEQEAFLPGTSKDDVKVEVVAKKQPNLPMEEEFPEERKSTCCPCCTRKRCLIISGILTGVVLAVLLIGYLRYLSAYSGTAAAASSETILGGIHTLSEEEADKLDISGIYKMNKYDENYEQYLSETGIPSLVITLIIGFNDIITIHAPANPNATWTWHADTASGELKTRFKLGHEFEVPYGSKVKGIMHKICHLEKPNLLSCKYEERKKNWNFNETFTFDESQMVQQIDFITKGIKTSRSFQKMSREEFEKQKQEEEDDSPFSADDNDEDYYVE